MIKKLRVDHRLLHGQVAFSWTSALNVDCILIANDSVMKDELRKTTLKMAKPNGVKLVMKNIEDSIKAINSGVTDKYKLFIVVESIADAAALIDGVESIKALNLDNDRQSVSGVDLNDEATNMMVFQKSYSAACQLMTTLDSMLDKLINGTIR